MKNGLGVLQVFIGIGAVGGGLGLVLEPSGENLRIPIDLLHNSPFSNYLVPGIFLLAINGLGNLVGSVLSFRRYLYAGETAMVLGVFLVVWIILQVYWIGSFHWLHACYLGLGLLEFFLGRSLRNALHREAI